MCVCNIGLNGLVICVLANDKVHGEIMRVEAGGGGGARLKQYIASP